MSLGKSVTFAGLGLAAFGLAVLTSGASVSACSSSDSTTPATDAGATSDTGAAATDSGTSIVAPGKPSAPATTSTAEHNFAIHQLFMGNASRTVDQATQDPNAWKSYGYNVDGKITGKGATDVCQRAPGASAQSQVDGPGGIDNSFGQTILPILLTFSGDAAKKINDSIAAGGFTVMLDTVGLSDDPAQTNTGLTGKLFAGTQFSNPDGGAPPTFTPADNWPVSAKSVNGLDVAQPKIKFDDAYVANGTWVNGSPADVNLALGIQGVTLQITVHHAVITFAHSAPGKGTNGTIAGVITTEELIAGIQGVAGSIATSLCSGSTFATIAAQIRGASDILSDGTNSPDKPCDAISIGIGFNADEIGKPTKAVEEVPGPDKCAALNGDAGTGDGG